MVDLEFKVVNAQAEPFAVVPMLAFALEVRQGSKSPVSIHSAILNCQVRFQPTRRHYSPQEQQRLKDLFDTPERWGRTLQSMLWLNTSVVLPPFCENTVVKLNLPCTFDFNVAAAKYFDALEEGEAPLLFLFSGTVFYEGSEGELQVAQIPWEKETTFRLGVSVWKQMMQLYYPNTAWLCLRKDLFDELGRFKSMHSLPTWDQAIESLLAQSPERVGEPS